MCIIIHNPEGKPVNPSHLRNAYANNPDGFGVMWCDPTSGKIDTSQGLFSFEAITDILKELRGIPHAIHFRFRTQGIISAEMTHPFRILKKEDDGTELWMMHNGTFTFPNMEENKSDSAIFAEKFRPIIKDLGTDVLFDNVHPRRLGERLGENNRVLFMRGDGKVSILNSQMGFIENGMWFSNQYSLKENYRIDKAKEKANKASKLQIPRMSAPMVWPKLL